MQRYVGDRFNLPSEGLTPGELERFLKVRGAPEELVREVSALVHQCDTARFAPVSIASDQMTATLEAAESLLKRLERWSPHLRASAVGGRPGSNS